MGFIAGLDVLEKEDLVIGHRTSIILSPSPYHNKYLSSTIQAANKNIGIFEWEILWHFVTRFCFQNKDDVLLID
jgi:hypothetical protein